MRISDLLEATLGTAPHRISRFSGSKLYHGTDILALAWILLSNRLDPSIDDNDGVSLATSLIEARGWAERSASIWANLHAHVFAEYGLESGLSPNGVVIALDGQRLALNHQLDHYLNPEYGDEGEVRSLGRIGPLSDYLVGLEYSAEDCLWMIKFLQTPYGRENYSNSEKTIAMLGTMAKRSASLTESNSAIDNDLAESALWWVQRWVSGSMDDPDWNDPSNPFNALQAFQWLKKNVPPRVPKILYRTITVPHREALQIERSQTLPVNPKSNLQSFTSSRKIAVEFANEKV
jgi:hypothetical protein